MYVNLDSLLDNSQKYAVTSIYVSSTAVYSIWLAQF